MIRPPATRDRAGYSERVAGHAPVRAVRPWRLLGLVALVLVSVALVRQLGGTDLLTLEGLSRLRGWMEPLGPLGPLCFIAVYVVGVVAFVPSLPMTVTAGLLFGPVLGTCYSSLASTLGACLAFLIARYAARDAVVHWIARPALLAHLDRAAAHHGYRLVMITRLVPIFPFNIQNYAYGVTGIRFLPYALTSWLCMLPATVVFTLFGGALSEGSIDVQ